MEVSREGVQKLVSLDEGDGGKGNVKDIVDELRKTAPTDPEGAQQRAWTLIKNLGSQLSKDRDTAMNSLAELFAHGDKPSGLDGPTVGALVGWTAQPIADRAMSTITSLWLPWVGKRFDAQDNSGDNLMEGVVRVLGRLVWPIYKFKSYGDKTSGFGFKTWTEPGKLDPSTEVLVIDYKSVPSNPKFLIRSIRDELVQLVPGVYLGKMLWRSQKGSQERHTLLAYFALKSDLVK